MILEEDEKIDDLIVELRSFLSEHKDRINVLKEDTPSPKKDIPSKSEYLKLFKTLKEYINRLREQQKLKYKK